MSLSATICAAFAGLSAHLWIASQKAVGLIVPATELLEAAARARCQCHCAESVVFQPTVGLTALLLAFVCHVLTLAGFQYWRSGIAACPSPCEAVAEVVSSPVSAIEHVEPRRTGKRRNPIGIIDLS